MTLRRWLRPTVTAAVCCVALIAGLPDLAWGCGQASVRAVPTAWPTVSRMINDHPGRWRCCLRAPCGASPGRGRHPCSTRCPLAARRRAGDRRPDRFGVTVPVKAPTPRGAGLLLAGLIRGRFAMQVWTGWSSSRDCRRHGRGAGPSTCCRRLS
ncbi:transmembrane domain protein [Mycobacterium xenopi 3993]|nr:transmembrane domain protein [Mycobacterium xenopi 3993]